MNTSVPRSASTRTIRAWIALAAIACCAALAVSTRAQDSDFARITAEGERAILAHPRIPPVGTTSADVVVVEYFDYNCPYCKRLAQPLRALLARDPKVALLYKDWPILGPVSVYAARAALAASWQGKYVAAHDALLAGPRLKADADVDAVLANAGIDVTAVHADMKRHDREIADELARNEREADHLDLQGTPGLLVGRILAPGAPDEAALDSLVAQARREARQKR